LQRSRPAAYRGTGEIAVALASRRISPSPSNKRHHRAQF
jgi:hypothetical protein